MNWKAWFTKKPDLPEEPPKEEPISTPPDQLAPKGYEAPGKKLADEQLHFVIRMIACFTPSSEISKKLRDNYGVHITSKQIAQYKNSEQWKPYLEKLRSVWLQQVMEEPIANKRVRLQRLDACYEGAFKDGEFRDATVAIKEAREEMEPKNSQYQIQMNQFNFLSDEDLIQLKQKQSEKVKRLKDIEVKGGTNHG
mgnify:CR=1 FL=1